jgi:hypothetical protein
MTQAQLTQDLPGYAQNLGEPVADQMFAFWSTEVLPLCLLTDNFDEQLSNLESFWTSLSDAVRRSMPKETSNFQRLSVKRMLKKLMQTSFSLNTSRTAFQDEAPTMRFLEQFHSTESKLLSKLFIGSEGLFTQEIDFWKNWEPTKSPLGEDSLFGPTPTTTAHTSTLSMAATFKETAANASSLVDGSQSLGAQLENHFATPAADLIKNTGKISGYIALRAKEDAPYYCANLGDLDPTNCVEFKTFHPCGKVRFHYRGPASVNALLMINAEKESLIARHHRELERFDFKKHGIKRPRQDAYGQ